MGNLILLTDEFPLNNGEPFLETEIQYYSDFDNVYIIPLSYNKQENIRPYFNHKLVLIKCSKTQICLYALQLLLKKEVFKEVVFLKKNDKLNITNIKHMLLYYARTYFIFKNIPRRINISKEDVIYSYWMTNGAHIATKLKDKYGVKAVSRCHRYDLYETESGYIPFRENTLIHLDTIIPISRQGKTYLLDTYHYLRAEQEKIKVSYLGSKKTVFRNFTIKDEINLLSCSNVISVKRIDKIIGILKEIDDLKINWYHIGSGDLMGNMEKQSKEIPSNINIKFCGQLSNRRIFDFYKEHDIHLFINTSDSEGIPVSIMEAMSFGTPIIATDVGGVSEIVKNECGLLVKKDFEYAEVVEYITNLFNLSDDSYCRLRKSAYDMWDEEFNSEKNYTFFTKTLLGKKGCD